MPDVLEEEALYAVPELLQPVHVVLLHEAGSGGRVGRTGGELPDLLLGAIVPAHVGDQVAVFFFQAEDGIRDVAVTGVQTCALPISARAASSSRSPCSAARARRRSPRKPSCRSADGPSGCGTERRACRPSCRAGTGPAARSSARAKIGRATCRERV